MSRPLRFVLAAVALAVPACGGGGGGTTPSPVTSSGGAVMPPAGTTTWAISYRAATASTCPAQTPDPGMATMTVDPSGTSLVLTDQGSSLSGGGPASIVFTRDGSGRYSWADPSGLATISFRFTTSSHAEGEANRLASPSSPCSATWPFLLDRQ
jgi:hypothetical protein